eukprot:7069077-Karenia_brevis.AAC.1
MPPRQVVQQHPKAPRQTFSDYWSPKYIELQQIPYQDKACCCAMMYPEECAEHLVGKDVPEAFYDALMYSACIY